MSSETSKDTQAPSAPEALHTTIGNMNSTLEKSLKTYQERSAALANVGPSSADLAERLAALRVDLDTQAKQQEKWVRDIKTGIKPKTKEDIAKSVATYIQEQITAEVAKEVKAQMELQIGDHLPVPLATQAEDSRMQIVAVKQALQNSEARRRNSVLRASPSNLADPLAVVLCPDGKESALYPADLRSLFAYDNVKAKALLKDFGLRDYGVHEKNLSRFMAHIGIRFELVPVPASSAAGIQKEAALVPLSA